MSTPLRLRVGTRASHLARTQTAQVVQALLAQSPGAEIEIVPIVTEGDINLAELTQIGATGVFVTALRTALRQGRIDIAVHSYKDLPTAAVDGLAIAAVPARQDPRDALIARDGLTLGELPAGARVGTGSPRRVAQLKALGLGLELVPVRGNVDTRLGKVSSGELDAVVLALAGLRRIDRADVVTEILDPIQVLPAPAQGALAIEARSDDQAALEVTARLDDLDTRSAITAERALLAALQAGCSSPVAALADVIDGDYATEVFLRGSVTAIDGSDAVRLSATGPATNAVGVGHALAADLLANGADTMLGSPV